MTDADMDNDAHEFIDITEVPLPECEIVSSVPAPMPSLICCNDQYMAGTVLQVFKQEAYFMYVKFEKIFIGLLWSKR